MLRILVLKGSREATTSFDFVTIARPDPERRESPGTTLGEHLSYSPQSGEKD